jgi:hypothetical protein
MKLKYGDLEVEIERGELTYQETDQITTDNFFGDPDGRWERKQFEGGHKLILLFYLYELIERQKPIPNWVREAFCSACKKVYGFEVESWDDVFGRRLKKGQQLPAQRKKLQIKRPLFIEVLDRNEAGEGIGKELFASVGKKFGVSATLAEEIYYEMLRQEFGGRSKPAPGKI